MSENIIKQVCTKLNLTLQKLADMYNTPRKTNNFL